MHKFGRPFRTFYPGLTWRRKVTTKSVFLTFDDGPVPEATPEVLDILDAYNAKATFFCVGNNIEKHPEVFAEVLKRGHKVGNHTYNHLNGRKTETQEYLDNVQLCTDVMGETNQGNLYRPPYGRMNAKQLSVLKDKYEVVMWEVLTKDYDTRVSKEDCLNNSLKVTSKGSIVLFHDSIKSIEKVRWVLPRYLEALASQGYTFELL